MTDMKVMVDSIEIYYRSLGHGRPLLLLHGWGCDGDIFDGFASELAKGYRLIIPDLPGFGRSASPPVSGWQVGQYAVSIDRFWQKIGLDKPRAIIGHSLGGRIAVYLASHDLLPSDRLVLLAAAGVRSGNRRLVIYRVLAKVGRGLTVMLPATIRQRLRSALYRRAGNADYISASETMRNTFRKITAENLRTTARNITVPTLLIYGAEDDTTPANEARIYHQLIRGSRLEIIPRAGHFVFADADKATIRLVREFLK